MSDDESLEDVNEENLEGDNLSKPHVIDKYRDAAIIANDVMLELIQNCVPGRDVYELCVGSDRIIEERVSQTYAKVTSKGIAFPTCISANNCAGNFSPLIPNESYTLAEGDVVKIDLGVHIDGYISCVAHTIICGQTSPEQTISGKVADAICAAHFAGECALKLLRPGKTNTDVTVAVQRVASVFNVSPVQGVLSHELSRFKIDGKNVIINKPDVDQLVEEFQFEVNQAYCVDIVMSTGEGKTRQMDSRVSIYKRNPEVNYSLKMKSSRNLLNQIKKKNTLPFNLRSFEDARSRLGITELVSHNLVDSYPVMWERKGEVVAQFKFTVIILPTQTRKLNEGFPLPYVNSEFNVQSDPQLAQIMAMNLKRTKKKKKKKNTNRQNTQNTEQPNNQDPNTQPPNNQGTNDAMDTGE